MLVAQAKKTKKDNSLPLYKVPPKGAARAGWSLAPLTAIGCRHGAGGF